MHCKHCNQTKLPGDFYASARSKCKDCTKSSVNDHRQKNLEKVRAYDRLRGSMPHRVAARAEYSKTDAYAVSHEASARRWAEKHPARRQANVVLGNAVRDGKVIPWPLCAMPDCCDTPQGHHPDYLRPLDVVWLCPLHHKQAHAIAANEPTLKLEA